MTEYSIIEADIESDRNDIINILKKAEWNSSYDRSNYDWKYLNCPSGKARCWLAIENSSNSIFGISSSFPRSIFIDKKPVDTITIGDFFIEKKYRGFGPGIHMQKKILSEFKNNNKKHLIYGIPNSKSFRICQKLQYTNIGFIKQYVKPLNISKILENRSFDSKFLKVKFFQKLLGALIKSLSKEIYYKKRSNYKIEILDFFDERFDIFWRKTINGYSNISDKSSKMLNWRYKENPDRNFKVFCMSDKNNDLSGYIVFIEVNNNYQIFDINFLKNKKILKNLLSEFSLYARENNIGAVILYFCGDKNFLKKFRSFIFYPVKSNDNTFVINPLFFNPGEINIMQNKNNWHITLGDKF